MAAAVMCALSLAAGIKVVLSDPKPNPETFDLRQTQKPKLILTELPPLEVRPVPTPKLIPPSVRRGTGRQSSIRSQNRVNELERIAQCESGGSYGAKNPSSSASGKYQILDSTWRGTSPGKLKDKEGKYVYPSARSAPPEQQDAAANELWDGGRGASHWRACR